MTKFFGVITIALLKKAYISFYNDSFFPTPLIVMKQ